MEDIEDSEFVASEHDRLITAVSKLDKTQHITEPTRNEPTNLNSEFNLIRRANKLDLGNVVKVLKDTAHHVEISKRLKKTQEASKVLPKPLEKPQAQRIKRATGYEDAKKKVGRWDAVVARSRTVDFVSFPLKNTVTKLQPTGEFLSKLKLKSPLEKELDEIDPPPAVEESEEEEQTYPMSYEEMVEHRQQTAKMRAQESYKAAKAKRQSKIKSKKYHRILKKEKLKQQLKEFEELQKNDPEEALKRLEALEKARALERHTLRHKNTGKWAKSKLVRAKYDKEVRQELAEQLAVSRGLTHKTQDNESSDDEADGENIPDMTLSQDPMNPWMMTTSGKSNVNAEFNFEYKKYLNEKKKLQIDSSDSEDNTNEEIQTSSDLKLLKEGINKIYKNSSKTRIEDVPNPVSVSNIKIPHQKTTKPKIKFTKPIATSDWTVVSVSDKTVPADVSSAFESLETNVTVQVEKRLAKLRKNIQELEKVRKPKEQTKQARNDNKDNLEYLKFKNQKVKPIIDEALNESTKKTADNTYNTENVTGKLLKSSALLNQETQLGNTKSDIDPSTFIEVKPKYLNTALSDYNECDQLDDDEQVVPRVNIEDVFEEDDVVASFRQEKEDENNKDQPKDIDLSLPGWGSWGGKGVKAPKRKRNRFILKAPPKMPRRDENKGDIIIKEYSDPKLASHKVTDVPFPFESVKEYEASIRTPLGNTFITEKAHKKLIKPSVITKAGAIIEPMDEDELLVKKNRTFKNKSVLKLVAKK